MRLFGLIVLAGLTGLSIASAGSVTQTAAELKGGIFEAAPFIGLSILITMGALTPGIIATVRKHDRAISIWAISLFAGWTVIGWIGAFAWACADPSPCATFPVVGGGAERDLYTDALHITKSL
jgi:hypothetical protein